MSDAADSNRKLPPVETRWKPGQSGNPLGPRRRIDQFAGYIGKQTQDGKEMADFLLKVMRDERAPRQLQLTACLELNNRFLGKSTQQLQVVGNSPEEQVAQLTPEQVESEVRKRLGLPPIPEPTVDAPTKPPSDGEAH